MKKFLLSFAVVLLSLSSYAQFDRGTMMVGGAFGLEFNTNKDKMDGNSSDNYKSTTFALEPQIGFFVIDNLAIGGGLGFSTSTFKDDGAFIDKTTSTRFSIEPFVRYYLPQRIFFQGKALLGLASTKYTGDGESEKIDYGLTGAAISAGYAILLNDNIAIEPQVGFESVGYSNKDSDIKNIDNTFFIRAAFQIYLRK